MSFEQWGNDDEDDDWEKEKNERKSYKIQDWARAFAVLLLLFLVIAAVLYFNFDSRNGP